MIKNFNLIFKLLNLDYKLYFLAFETIVAVEEKGIQNFINSKNFSFEANKIYTIQQNYLLSVGEHKTYSRLYTSTISDTNENNILIKTTSML